MSHFLIVYDRKKAQLREIREFESIDRARALRERFSRELFELRYPDTEVVLLEADSLEQLQNTHARYFRSAEELSKPHSEH